MIVSSKTHQWRDLWQLYCPEFDISELEISDWLPQSPLIQQSDDSPIAFCHWLGRLYTAQIPESHRKSYGQYFTHPSVARFMADLCLFSHENKQIFEPAAGTGILIAAIAEKMALQKDCSFFRIHAYETDPKLLPALKLSLGYIRNWLLKHHIKTEFTITPKDFITSNIDLLRPAPLLENTGGIVRPQLIIANPPYFKIPKSDARVNLLPEITHGQPNVYTLFMATAAKILEPNGQLVFITPRSFCSGPYFQQFRHWFFRNIAIERLHSFASRTLTFEHDSVLQENIILSGRKTSVHQDTIIVSSSEGSGDLASAVQQPVRLREILDLESSTAILYIPTHTTDGTIRGIFSQWSDRLQSLGLKISTGPIVPFRTEALRDAEGREKTAPVLWMQHLGRMQTTWPLARLGKPQHICITENTRSLLVQNQTYVLIRRFSAKEENSRITASPYIKDTLPYPLLGLENHVNYIHRPKGSLTETEAFGLAAYLNSRWVDQYFRQISGNTQVNAAEIRDLPLPPLEKINSIGGRILQADPAAQIVIMNQVVAEVLGLPTDLPNGKGGHMSKIEDAKSLLGALGLPPAQRNELAALILLALANLKETDKWSDAQRRSIRVHDMIVFVEQNYHKRYAENTRETFRRQVLHQFEQARLVDRNPDDATLPTNSPRTHYAISESLLPVLQNYGLKAGSRLLQEFISQQGTLLDLYRRQRSEKMIPLRDPSGKEYRLSPGKHNLLQVLVIEQFAPRFARGAKLLYFGDTANKSLILDVRALQKVGFSADKHGKLPDIVLYSPKQKWLYLIEVVTSHGPVSPKRYQELVAILANSTVARIYVSVFPDFKEYQRHARNIAWETEIWIADAPDHLIHYNGAKFFGPRPKNVKKRK